MSGVFIRIANKSDVKSLATLGARTFFDAYIDQHKESDLLKYIATEYSEEKTAEYLSNPLIKYFIAIINDEVVGFIRLKLDVFVKNRPQKRVIEIEKIYALKPFIGHKIGKELMLSAINYARENKYDGLYLGVWQENKRAVDFYTKFNFETIDTRQFQLGDRLCDDFMMYLEVYC